ncbi:hypothetical protein BACINT_00731 [Bacteroides intestinalis DSM 17393]|uniref:Uncharacterized protein n=1 Tax=Bacteroides intestinalis DSM 17393 TaxID=471870 RepID=B3C741_9BACE|nr:hypothetical protein BACINT_00731 [Bacteroides intestinalis DSM 17393]
MNGSEIVPVWEKSHKMKFWKFLYWYIKKNYIFVSNSKSNCV